MYVMFRFGAKINHFKGSQPSFSSKNLDCIFLCSTYKIFEKIFLKVFRYSFSETLPIFFNHFKSDIILV